MTEQIATLGDISPEISTEENIFCCPIDRALRDGSLKIWLPAAMKVQDSNSKIYISYTIRFGNTELKRRYSEFAALREILVRKYPVVIIPPVPEKHSIASHIADYATLQGQRSKEDPSLMERRKRLLARFLMRVAKHPILSTDHLVHLFLDPEVNVVTDILQNEAVLQLPKNPASIAPGSAKNAEQNGHTRADLLASTLPPFPVPSPKRPLKHPDLYFEERETFVDNWRAKVRENEQCQKRIAKKYFELSSCHAQAGAIYNGFSLTEGEGVLAPLLEKIGQAEDCAFLATNAMVASLEATVEEPLHEVERYAAGSKEILTYRRVRHLQMEIIEDQLKRKEKHLEDLLKAGPPLKITDSSVLPEADPRHEIPQPSSTLTDPEISDLFPPGVGTAREEENEENEEDGQANQDESSRLLHQRSDSIISSSTVSLGSTFHSPAMGAGYRPNVFGRLTNVFNGFLDVDPEATRRSEVTKTRNQIKLLAGQLEASSDELTRVNAAVRQDLDRQQRERWRDLKEIMTCYARTQNIKSWEEAKEEAEKIK